MFKRVKKFFIKFFAYDRSPHRLALACSFALYIAFSPFIGLHTIMLIGAGWLWRLNIPLLLMLGYTINNPLTMVPIIMSGYVTGHWLLHSWLNISLPVDNPWWVAWFDNLLHTYVGVQKISFWAFMVGANIVGILLAIICYPIMKKVFEKLSGRARRKGRV